jgi:hypothetical protein
MLVVSLYGLTDKFQLLESFVTALHKDSSNLANSLWFIICLIGYKDLVFLFFFFCCFPTLFVINAEIWI